jgi:hypothetical protein
MKITNDQNLPVALYDALAKDTYQKVGDFSATEIIAPPRIRVLKKIYYGQLKEDCSEHIFRLFGSLIHEMINLADVKNALQEERLEAIVPGLWDARLTGAPDLFDQDSTLWDFKVTSRWVAVFGAKDDWEKQLNIYDFLFWVNGFTVKQAKVCAIFRDWSKTQAAKDKDYPQQQVKVFDIPLWNHEVQQDYIETRIKTHQAAEKLSANELPPCTPDERWEKPTKYAVMKNKNKRATRLFDNSTDAEEFINGQKQPSEHDWRIELRTGESTRCEYYCMVKDFCDQYQESLKGEKKK